MKKCVVYSYYFYWENDTVMENIDLMRDKNSMGFYI